MARKAESGIEYFPLNSDIIHNPKIKLVVAEFGSKLTWAVLLPLYCKIYREKGYWIDWFDEDSKLLFAQDECKVELSVVNELVAGCVRRSLFNKEVFDLFGVLTSDRIQENYLIAKSRNKEVDFIEEFALKNQKREYVYNSFKNVNIIALNVNIIAKKVNIGTQNKKEKKIIEGEGEKAAPPPTAQVDFEKREEDFYQSIKPYLSFYGKDLLRKFFDYWREPNKSRTKMRWEQEKTWDLNLRLQRWASSEFNKTGDNHQAAAIANKKLSEAVKAIENANH